MPTETESSIGSRYKRFCDLTMDGSSFPVTWRDDGVRSAFIESYLSGVTGRAGDVPADWSVPPGKNGGGR